MKKSISRLVAFISDFEFEAHFALGLPLFIISDFTFQRPRMNRSFDLIPFIESSEPIHTTIPVGIELNSPSGASNKLCERIDSRATYTSSQWPGISSSPDLAHAHIEKECGLRSSPKIKLFDGHNSINHVESNISARFFGCRCQPRTFIVLLLLLTLGRWHDVPR